MGLKHLTILKNVTDECRLMFPALKSVDDERLQMRFKATAGGQGLPEIHIIPNIGRLGPNGLQLSKKLSQRM
jgi:hypothetical protein